ncbi:HEPN domain-containing protein [Clostridium vincentii]|uniref:RiboL-PSP-HEPN domain-containing protein n=1 Tax=Clostridium vincentii TaxID=52704 RepID=A0A2T0BKY9_9CLOT|nr:HEPN domain-containing protein [Clostridium vincentii]PRR84564.1 hypothetical protein CLVI_00870 [Clostridium vincentii]
MRQYIAQLEKIESKLEQICLFIDSIEIQKKVILEIRKNNEDLSNMEMTNTIKIKSYMEALVNSEIQYNAIIISIYGCFENFLDEMSKLYMESIFEYTEYYSELSINSRNKYIQKVGEFLTNPQRFLRMDIDTKGVVENAYNCLCGNEVNIFTPLITAHGGNLKYGQVCLLLKDIGIEDVNNKILHNEYIKRWYMDRDGYAYDMVQQYINDLGENAFKILDELVDERNKVAHGNVEQRKALNLIKEETIPFLKYFSRELCDIVIGELYLLMYGKNILKPFENAIDVINNYILCINSGKSFLRKGDYIFAYFNNIGIPLKIESIEIDRISIENINSENINVGIKVDKRIKKEYEFFYFDINE